MNKKTPKNLQQLPLKQSENLNNRILTTSTSIWSFRLNPVQGRKMVNNMDK